MTERQFQRLITDAATLYGWRWYHTHDSRRSQAGFPDLVMVRDGRMLAWELKTERGRIRPQQQAWIDALATVPGVDSRIVRPSTPWMAALERDIVV